MKRDGLDSPCSVGVVRAGLVAASVCDGQLLQRQDAVQQDQRVRSDRVFDSNCHGTGVNKNDIQNAAGNPGLIDQALDGPPGDPGVWGFGQRWGLHTPISTTSRRGSFTRHRARFPRPCCAGFARPVMFGSTNVGSTSAPIAVTVTNVGGADATGVSLTNSNAAEPCSSGSTCSGTLTAGGGTSSFNVAFKPSASGARSASITVNRSGSRHHDRRERDRFHPA